MAKRTRIACKISVGEVVASSSKRKFKFLKMYNVIKKYNVVNFNTVETILTLK